MTRPQGVNAELAPLVRMTFPVEASLADLADAPRNQPLFACWLLGFGFLPFDRHVLIIQDAGPTWFIETSHSWYQSLWRHERYVRATEQGCEVRDILTVKPRLAFMQGLTNAVVGGIFRHRHRRLLALYGA